MSDVSRAQVLELIDWYLADAPMYVGVEDLLRSLRESVEELPARW